MGPLGALYILAEATPSPFTPCPVQVLQLSRSPENLEALIQNEALVGLLARLLKEEGKKSQVRQRRGNMRRALEVAAKGWLEG